MYGSICLKKMCFCLSGGQTLFQQLAFTVQSPANLLLNDIMRLQVIVSIFAPDTERVFSFDFVARDPGRMNIGFPINRHFGS